MLSKHDRMRAIRDEVVAFDKTDLYTYRIQHKNFPVIGEGNHDASIMFIGEAPGKNEAQTGKPFCGASGRILDELLASINLDRKTVYVTNIVKDRPPENRDPTPHEIELYAPFLDRQIDIIQPRVIATLGRFSMHYIMNRYGLQDKVGTISQLHGRDLETTMSYGNVHIIPLYHPAVAVYNAQSKDELKKDFHILTQYM